MIIFISCKDGNKDLNNTPIFSCYLDSENKTATIDDIEIYIDDYFEIASLNYELHFNLIALNNQNKNAQIRFDSVHVVRESTGFSYQCEFPARIDIKAGLKANMVVQFEIPNSVKKEKYYLELNLNGSLMRFYLYSTPDELLESHTITYLIDGKVVHEEQVLHGKSIPEYQWFSEDGLYYCVKWLHEGTEDSKYSVDNYKYSYTVKEDIEIKGVKIDMLQYMSLSSDRYAYATELNKDGVTPPSKTLVVPRTYKGKPVRISNFFFDSGLKDIEIVYIPNTDKIYSQSFIGTKVKEIHFAGSKEEWETFDVDVPSRIKIYYNSTFDANK